MNFRPDLARAVLDARKTVTRRLASDNPRSPWWRERCGLGAGDSFAVCPGRGQRAVCRARVISAARVSLGRLDEREAAREGFASAQEFERAFAAINGGYDPDVVVWRIEFELLDRYEPEAGADRGTETVADRASAAPLPTSQSDPVAQAATRRPSTSAPAAGGDTSREALAGDQTHRKRCAGLGSGIRHELDRAGSRLGDRFAQRVSRRGGGEGKWRWSDERASGCERAIRELIADAARQSTGGLERRAGSALAAAHAILDERERPAGAGAVGGGGGEEWRSAGGKAPSDTSRTQRGARRSPGMPGSANTAAGSSSASSGGVSAAVSRPPAGSSAELVNVGEASGAVAETRRCPDCFGCGEPCAVCVAAAGDPSSGEYELGPGVEQVRRCACGRVYGAYHASRRLCFLVQAPGRRQVKRCVRCAQRLTARTTSDCTAELQDATRTSGGDGGGEDDGGKAPGGTSRAPGGERVCGRPGCTRPIPDASRPQARYWGCR